MGSPDIIVIGAGAVGASCAWQLARRGHGVLVVDDSESPAASHVAAGMLAPVTEAQFGEEALFKLNLASSEMYPAFIEQLYDEVGREVGYRQCGTVLIARDRDDNEVLEDVYEFQHRLGMQSQRLSSRAARDLEPALSPRVRSGILIEGDHQVDPTALTEALIAACDGANVTRRTDRVVEVGSEGPGAWVRLADGEKLACGIVLVAAGSYTGTIGGDLAIPPVRPVKGQLVHLRARGGVPLPSRNIRGIDVYVVTRADGRVVVGATVEEQGFDRTLTAGAAFELLRDAYELLPGLVELEFLGVTAGLRPATPDNAPVIGWMAPQVAIAGGHYRHGILLVPITAQAVVGLVEGHAPDVIAPFDPHRFGARERATR